VALFGLLHAIMSFVQIINHHYWSTSNTADAKKL